MDVAITRMSSKGQIVIPAEMRDDFEEGDKMILIRDKDQFIMKKAKKSDKMFADDLTFAKRTNAALKRYEKGKFIDMDFEEFLEKAKKW